MGSQGKFFKTGKLTLFLLVINLTAFGQSQEARDSLVSEICKAMIETKGQPDSTRIIVAYVKHLDRFLGQYPEEQREDIATNVYFRLQRNCIEFKDLLDRAEPNKGDWEVLDEKPKAVLKKNECRKLLDQKHFKYLEANGDTVSLTLDNGYWIDSFNDGTYSKLKLLPMSGCEFDIEFIESDNQARKGFSKPGDKYRYQVVDKKSTYYEMSVEVLGTGRHLKFRLYY